jgi:hypothetical protein
MDTDICTGTVADRFVGTATVIPGPTRNKFEYRGQKPSLVDSYTREYRIVAKLGSADTEVLTLNNITAGQYVMPITEWIQPEATTPGLAPLSHDFSNYRYLTQGLGRDLSGIIWGPLKPFPQTIDATKLFDVLKCPPLAGNSLGTSTSTGSATSLLTGTRAPTSSSTPTPPILPDTVAVVSASWISSGSGTLSVTCSSTSTDPKVAMRVTYNGADAGTAPMVQIANSGTWTLNNRKIKRPTLVTCVSQLFANNLAGTASRAL